MIGQRMYHETLGCYVIVEAIGQGERFVSRLYRGRRQWFWTPLSVLRGS